MSCRKFLIQTLLVMTVPIVAIGADRSSPQKLHGRLKKIGSIPVLKVWGTPQEMGFAHGTLVGQGVIDYVTETFAAVPPNQRAELDMAQQALVKAIHIPDRALAEIQGIFDGLIAANGKAPMIKPLKRPLRLDDLIFLNARDTTRSFGCSGFTVWGERAGDAGVITTRNFDFPVPGPKTLRQQMILVRRPRGKRQVATVTFPGYLGAVTGINDKGVCAFVHDGTGGKIRTPRGQYTPLGLVLLTLLETSRPRDVDGLAQSLLKDITPYPFSYMIRIVTPQTPKRERPVRVFHIDPRGMGENAAGESFCITTNHYIAGDLVADSQANHWSLLRYRELDKRIARPITDDEAWASLRAVAAKGGFSTLHSLVVYPERRELDVGFAKWKRGQVVPAPMRKPQRIKFDQLFKSRKSRKKVASHRSRK